jgi:hypothetical protein
MPLQPASLRRRRSSGLQRVRVRELRLRVMQSLLLLPLHVLRMQCRKRVRSTHVACRTARAAKRRPDRAAATSLERRVL